MPTRPISRTTAILFAVSLAAFGCAAPTVEPTASAGAGDPSPSGQATGPTAEPTPVVTLSPAQIEAQVETIEASVPALRQLEPASVPNRVVDEAAARLDFERVIDEAATAEEYAAAARLGERLGFFPAGTDLRQTQLDLLGDQVLGYYDEEADTMAVVQRGADFGPLERVTIAHEYTHALQDQAFDLEKVTPDDDVDNSDQDLARVAMVEGDASLVTQQWTLDNLTFEQILAITRQAMEQQAVLAGIPRLLVRQLEFPYAEGLLFATALFQQGGWEAVDAAYASPPDSTEQVIHPEKYATREAPVAVEPDITPATLGEGWSEAASDTVGELGIATWLESAGPTIARDASAGWGGDRVVLLEGPDDAWLVDWITSWDSPADAEAFTAAASRRITELGDRAVVRHTPGSQDVEIRIASVGELLRAGD
jgi:hypothetical protein